MQNKWPIILLFLLVLQGCSVFHAVVYDPNLPPRTSLTEPSLNAGAENVYVVSQISATDLLAYDRAFEIRCQRISEEDALRCAKNSAFEQGATVIHILEKSSRVCEVHEYNDVREYQGKTCFFLHVESFKPKKGK